MLSLLTAILMAAQPAAAAPLDAAPQIRLDGDLRCLLGVYALPGGQAVTITGTDGAPRALSFAFSTGRFGALNETAKGRFTADDLTIEFAPCKSGTLKLQQGQTLQRGTRLRLIERMTTFSSGGTSLHGKLIMPATGQARAAAVWIEGSNNDPSTDDAVWPYELARRGVAAFVYDKRGTGASKGAPSSDFHVRAQDTAAAVKEMRRLAPQIRRIGVIGGSQGGWVAPLAATMAPLDFVIPAFAMAEGPIAQDRELVMQQLRDGGFDGTAQAQARELTAITERIVRTNMREGLDELDAFKAAHAAAPWLKAIQPRSYTGLFLLFPSAVIKTNGPAMAQGLSFDFEPRPVIEAIKARQLWLLGGSDRQAPNTGTQVILKQIQQQRRDLAVVVFPKADHGLIEPASGNAGAAKVYSAGQFDIAANWIKSGTLPGAGQFILLPVAD
ncbi:alpha/beta hydrolase family protein [Novosphingobium sp. B 225]|uniref:alpha/beta hydrolase family protein n=1 Tax=Novosphingobium sp. B 225 TaxID=1961849 RepID=UPI000B4AF259|nr:alpha/beta hydrolase [Novosphingobium sp. B 225]